MCYLKCFCFLSLALILGACSGNTSSNTVTLTSNSPGPGPAAKFANLSTIGSIELGRDTYTAAISNTNNVYYTDWTLGLSSVDISNPQSPTILKTLVDPFHSISNLNGYDNMYGLIIAGNTAVVSVNPACLGMCAGDSRETQLYDLSTSGEPRIMARMSIHADNVIAVGNMLYITESNTWFTGNFLNIVDISKPGEPIHISRTSISDPGYLAFKNNIIYISQIHYNDIDSNKYRNIQTLDVSDPYKPIDEKPSSWVSFNQTYSPILISGNVLYFLDYKGLNIVNISDRLNPVFIKSISLSSTTAKSFSSYNNKLYIAAGNSGVMVFDISQPENPIHLKSMKSNTDALSVTVSNGVGTYITDVLRQTSNGGYSTAKGYMLNIFYDK